jgi:integrase/recombinase XerD
MMRRRLRLLLPDWPEPDRTALDAAFTKEDRFRHGPAAHWAQSTRDTVEIANGRWLGFLALSEPSALTEHPVERLTEERLTRYVDHLAETAESVGRYVYLEHLQRGLRVMYPGRTSVILNAAVAQLQCEYKPRPKPWVTTPRLTALGKKMIQEAVGKDREPRKILYRDGLMLMLWPPRPVRRRAFAAIRIGKQLRRVGEEWRLIFDGSEMKSGRPFEITVPRKVVPFLERFLREVRPAFLGAEDHDALWISSKGRPLTLNAISHLIAQRTEAAFGYRIPPHRFRHCAASTIAVFDPGRIELAPGLLDHASLRTTSKHYILAQGIEARPSIGFPRRI